MLTATHGYTHTRVLLKLWKVFFLSFDHSRRLGGRLSGGVVTVWGDWGGCRRGAGLGEAPRVHVPLRTDRSPLFWGSV